MAHPAQASFPDAGPGEGRVLVTFSHQTRSTMSVSTSPSPKRGPALFLDRYVRQPWILAPTSFPRLRRLAVFRLHSACGVKLQ